MAIIKKCDICNETYEKDSAEVIMDRPVRGLTLLSDFKHSSARVDLCPDCGKSFKEWFMSRQK